MKFLEDRELSQLNSFLAHVNLGDHVVTGQLENYSCAFVVVVCDDRCSSFFHSSSSSREREREFFFFVSKGRAPLSSLLSSSSSSSSSSAELTLTANPQTCDAS